MEELDSRVWQDMLCELLGDGSDAARDGAESGLPDDDYLLAEFADGVFGDGIGFAGADGEAWPGDAAVGDVPWDQIDVPDLGEDFLLQDSVSLPSLVSEVSSLPEAKSPVADNTNSGKEAAEAPQGTGVSSPGSCSRADVDCGSSQNEARSPRSAVVNCAAPKRASPDTEDSSDVGAMGRSCDNFADVAKQGVDSTPKDVDDDAKRQSRLMRNRESATQSRLRKKSYVKDLEIKCRAMESQLTMLHQTVAATSAQNAALREELARVKASKGSKTGAMEPAVLPSDSLPPESPSHHTGTCLSVKLELVAFLCLALLLGLLQVVPRSPAANGGNNPSEARNEKQHTDLIPSRRTRRFSSVFRKGRRSSSVRRKNRCASRTENISLAAHRKSLIRVYSTLLPL